MNSVYGGGLQGLEYATVYATGHALDNNSNPVSVNGATEIVTNIFRYEMPTYGTDIWTYDGLGYWSTKIGVPQY
jgi:hypothetical protein